MEEKEKVEVPKEVLKPPKKPPVGKKGVMAKRVAMEATVKKMEEGVADIQSATQAQTRETEEAVKKIQSGVKKIQSDMKKLQDEVKGYVRDFYYG